MAPSVSAYVPASSRRRPLISRRAHSSHGATRVSFTACSTVAISGGLRCCSAAYFRSFHRSPRNDRGLRAISPLGSRIALTSHRGQLRRCSAAYFRSFHRSPRSDLGLRVLSPLGSPIALPSHPGQLQPCSAASFTSFHASPPNHLTHRK